MKAARAWVHGLVALAWLGGPAGAATPFAVSVEGEDLSVVAEGAPLAHILAEIARQSRVDIRLESAIEGDMEKATIMIALDRVPIEEGLRRLLQGRSMMLLYDATGLVEARIYLDGSGHFRSLRAAGRAAGPERGPSRSRPVPSDLEEFSARLDALAAAGNKNAVAEEALEMLGQTRDPELRETALSALSGLDRVPLAPLLRVAEAEANPELKIQALDLLIEHGGSDPRVGAFLTKLAKESGNADVREAAARLLDDLRSQEREAPPARAPRQPRPASAARPSPRAR